MEVLRCCARGGNPQAVDADYLAGVGVVDERLGLASPGHGGPQGRIRCDHGAGGIHRIAALLEDLRARGRRERLAGDRHPVPCVQRRLLGAALRLRCAENDAGAHQRDQRGQRAAHESANACSLRLAFVRSRMTPPDCRGWIWRGAYHMADFRAAHIAMRDGDAAKRALPAEPKNNGNTAAGVPSDVQVDDRQGVLLDELAARLHLIAHERRENIVRGDRVFDLHLQETP